MYVLQCNNVANKLYSSPPSATLCPPGACPSYSRVHPPARRTPVVTTRAPARPPLALPTPARQLPYPSTLYIHPSTDSGETTRSMRRDKSIVTVFGLLQLSAGITAERTSD